MVKLKSSVDAVLNSYFLSRPLKNDVFDEMDNCVLRKVHIGFFHFALSRSFKSTPSLAQK